jgi:hypothetical protein
VITGPFAEVRTDAITLHRNGRNERKVWYRQGKPYKRPLAYLHTFNTYKWTPSVDPRLLPVVAQNAYNIGNNLVDLGEKSGYDFLYAKAYDRFMKKVGDKTGWVINLMEGGKSLEMVALRCKQLGSAFRNLKRFNIPGLVRDLSLHPADPRLKRLSRNGVQNNLANSWLELNFGWAPLIKDIHSSVEILQRDFPMAPLKGSATGLNLSLPVYRGTASQIESVRISGTLKVTNPQLFLANQLGLINPAAVVWDAVPFSFVIDWFIPVGKFLNSLTNEVGCEIVYPRITIQRSVIGNTIDGSEIVEDGSVIYLEGYSSYEGRFFERRAPPSLPLPSLMSRVTRPDFNAWKAVTSLALLTQQLKLR